VIVDAAAQLPPVSNLWHFTTELGADVAIFSGGKGLAGPQNSGLVVGREAIIRAIRLNGPPYQRFGRAMKVAKETMIGLLAAVELYLSTDHAARAAEWSAVVNSWQSAWQACLAPGMTLWREETNEAGEPIPRLLLRFGAEAPLGRDQMIEQLRSGDPAIEVVLNDPTSIAFSPHLLQPGESALVQERVVQILRASQSGGRPVAEAFAGSHDRSRHQA
jgi:L-seryl-tRNA(Ser) seleniumtransferase